MRLQGVVQVVRKRRIAFCECAEMVGLCLAAKYDSDNQLGGFCRKSCVRSLTWCSDGDCFAYP